MPAAPGPGNGSSNAVWCDMAAKVLVEDLLAWPAGAQRHQFAAPRAAGRALEPPANFARVLQPSSEDSARVKPGLFPGAGSSGWKDALLVASLELETQQGRQAALILALLRNPLRYAGSQFCSVVAKLKRRAPARFAMAQHTPRSHPGHAAEWQSATERFYHNFTQQARDGPTDPVLLPVIQHPPMIDIPGSAARQPIRGGEAGVGKTALVEGLALRIVQGESAAALKGGKSYIVWIWAYCRPAPASGIQKPLQGGD